MKRTFLIVALVTMFTVPAIAKTDWQEFKSHDTVYASWSHFWFSVWGYRHPTLKDAQRSNAEVWWGKSIVIDRSVSASSPFWHESVAADGFKHPTVNDVKVSEKERWWGQRIEVKK